MDKTPVSPFRVRLQSAPVPGNARGSGEYSLLFTDPLR